MRDPLAEPRTTPVPLRRRPVHEQLRVYASDLDGVIQSHGPLPGLTYVADGLERIAARLEVTPTLRDLLRAARAAGAPLRRQHHDHVMTEYWQCWDEGAHTRRAMVRHWPDGTWRVEIYGRHNNADGEPHEVNVVRVDLQNPSIEQISAAARLCGWDLGAS